MIIVIECLILCGLAVLVWIARDYIIWAQRRDALLAAREQEAIDARVAEQRRTRPSFGVAHDALFAQFERSREKA